MDNFNQSKITLLLISMRTPLLGSNFSGYIVLIDARIIPTNDQTGRLWFSYRG
jgi:hypothetical protein